MRGRNEEDASPAPEAVVDENADGDVSSAAPLLAPASTVSVPDVPGCVSELRRVHEDSCAGNPADVADAPVVSHTVSDENERPSGCAVDGAYGAYGANAANASDPPTGVHVVADA